MEEKDKNLNKQKSTGAVDSTAEYSGRSLKHWHIVSLWLIVYDIIVANGVYFLTLWLRYDCQYSQIPQDIQSSVA